MVPHPKRKHSKGRRDRRRAQDALTAPVLVKCRNCGEMHLAHAVCPSCGYYGTKEIISKESKKK